jgi:uncharacterized membrane protein YhhN
MIAVALLAGLGVCLAGEATGRFPLRAVGKLTASAAMVAWAVRCADEGAGAPTAAEAAWLLPGFALHALGDALLLGTGRWFLAGIGAFLVGHIAYAATFARLAARLATPDTSAAPGLAALAAMGVASWALLRWIGPRMGKMAGAVAAYTVAISCMVASAAQAGVTLGSAWLPAAAVVFAASDVLVARNRFVTASPMNRYLGLPMYYAAQWAFGAQLGG